MPLGVVHEYYTTLAALFFQLFWGLFLLYIAVTDLKFFIHVFLSHAQLISYSFAASTVIAVFCQTEIIMSVFR